MTVVKTVSGKLKVFTPSPVGMGLLGDSSLLKSFLMTCTRGWYLCMEWRMICKQQKRLKKSILYLYYFTSIYFQTVVKR